MMMMMVMMMMSLIITQSAAISQSSFCFVLPFFLEHGHTLNQQIQLLLLLCLFFLFSFPSLLPLASKDNSLDTWLWEVKAWGKVRLGKRLGKVEA
jgi:hypothetical protein